MVTSSRVIVMGVPFTSVENVPFCSSCTTSADDISFIRFATAFTCLPNLGPMTLKFALAVFRTIGEDASMNSMALTFISSRITSFIFSMRRRVSGEAGIAMRKSGWRVLRLVFVRMERTSPTTRCATSMRLSSSGLINSFLASIIGAMCTDSNGSLRVSLISER